MNSGSTGTDDFSGSSATSDIYGGLLTGTGDFSGATGTGDVASGVNYNDLSDALLTLSDAFSTGGAATGTIGGLGTQGTTAIPSMTVGGGLQSSQPQQMTISSGSAPSYKASNLKLKQLDPVKLKKLVTILKQRMGRV